MLGKFYVLSDAAPCCFSEATLGEFSATSGSPMTLLLRALFSFSYLLRALSGVVECQTGLVTFNRTVDFSIFLAWTPPTTVQVLRSTMVKVRCLCILWFSRYSRFSEHLPLNVMLLRNMMLYWAGSGRTAVFREPDFCL